VYQVIYKNHYIKGMEEKLMHQIYDFAVIGAGAAGLSAAQYGARAT